MDLNTFPYRNQFPLMAADRSPSLREKRACAQLAREYADQIESVRDALGTKPALPGAVT
jgi:hypothetical protein